MSGEIELADIRPLTYFMGHDSAGLWGRQAFEALPNLRMPNAGMAPLRKGLAKVRSNSQRLKVLVEGDSTQAGVGAGAGAGGTDGARALCPPAYVASKLNALGIPARSDAWFGNANVGSNTTAGYTLYNPSVIFGAGWARSAAADGIGSCRWLNSSDTTGIEFTPDRAADRFDIFYSTGSGFGTFTVTDASGTLATQSSAAGANGFTKLTATRAVASTAPISIQRNGTGAGVYISGVDPWNSTLAEVCMLNAAVSGKTAATFAAAGVPTDNLNAMLVVDPDMSYVELGLNDINTSVPLATYVANMQTIITSLLTMGGVAIGISHPAGVGGYNLPDDWKLAMANLAQANGGALVDHNSRFVSHASDTSLYKSGDPVHLLKSGYQMKGELMANLLIA